MKRNYISPEYNHVKVFGTLNMKEESSFFGSKMLEIEDSLLVGNGGIIYYQNQLGEQLDLSIENSLPSLVYSESDDKKNNHVLIIDESQTSFQRDNQTRYILTINLQSILNNYLFAILKQHRTFEGVKNNMTYNNDVSFSMKEYISKNILDRYKFDKIELFVKYNDLRDQSILRFSNTWNDQIGQESLKLKRLETKTEFDQSSIEVKFSQEKSSSLYSFEYYFNLFWSKL